MNIEDFKVEGFYDLKIAEPGTYAHDAEAPTLHQRALRWNCFKLGLKYSRAMNCAYLDKGRKACSYGVDTMHRGWGEQWRQQLNGHDENGMIMPFAIAPFEVCVLPVNSSHAESMEPAKVVYKELLGKGIDAIIDDRPERPGVQVPKDCDLIGIPIRVTIGGET